jgi:CHAT domain-containing protein/tetratricopeptide (TPR) repeat protein
MPLLGRSGTAAEHESALVAALDQARELFGRSDFDGALALIEGTLASSGHDLEGTGEQAPGASGEGKTIWTLRELAGRCLLQLQHYERSARVLGRAFQDATQLFGPESRQVAAALAALGDCHTRTGDFPVAEEELRRSLKIREQVLGSGHPDVAESAKLLGVVLHRSGDLAGAEPYYHRAISILTELGLHDDIRLANCLNNLGNLYHHTGDLHGAVELNEKALAIYRATYGPSSMAVSGSLLNLGLLWLDIGDLAAAGDLLARSLEIRRRLLGARHPAHAAILNSLATVHEESGELREAGALYGEALDLLTEALGVDHSRTALATFNLGGLLSKTGDLDQGRRLCRQSLEHWRKRLVPDHPNIAAAWHLLAEIERAAGRPEQALPSVYKAAQIRLQRSVMDFQILSGRQMQSYLDVNLDSFDLAMTLLEEVGDDQRQRWVQPIMELELLRRGRIAEELSVRQLTAALSRDAAARGVLEAYNRVREELAGLYVETSAESDPALATRLREVSAEKEELERQLARRNRQFGNEMRAAAITLEDVRRELPEGSRLVQLVRYLHHPPAAPGSQSSASLGELRDVALVLAGADASPLLVAIGSSAETDRLLAKLLGSTGPDGPRGPAEARRYRAASSALARWVWDPLAGVLGEPGLVFVVPEGPLHLVDFASLRSQAGVFLIEEDWVFHYLGSARDVVRFAGRQRHGPGSRSLLAVGDVAYGAASAGLNDGKRLWPGLPETATEVDAVSRLFSGDRVTVLRGEQASEASFKRLAASHTFVHLATHGFFTGAPHTGGDGDPATVRDTGAPGAGGAASQVARENPLLLSGVVLAGANDRTAAVAAADDGILTGEEVAALDLRRVDYAVLSACETGLGDVRIGEGVMGLRLAFRLAGAGTVVASLTRVGDEATRAWMAHFYQGLLGGRSVVEAANLASRQRLAEIRALSGSDVYPARWAPFLTAGDWK